MNVTKSSLSKTLLSLGYVDSWDKNSLKEVDFSIATLLTETGSDAA